jgi:hypothetical protein
MFALVTLLGLVGVAAALVRGHDGGATVIGLGLVPWWTLMWMFWRGSAFFGETARRS